MFLFAVFCTYKMEQLWKTMRDPKAIQVERKTSATNFTANDLLDCALANTNSENLSSMAVQFDKICKSFFI